jgi:hypothetical protein
MGMMFRRPSIAAVLAVALLAAGCGVTDGDADDTIPPATPVPTIAGVGVVPAVPTALREPVVIVRPPVDEDGTEAQLIGGAVEGNRVLMIGDSILASTSSRYGNHMCEVVVPLGWKAAVEAEPSRFIDFGNRVLDKALPEDVDPEDDWDAAVIFLGSNYGGDAQKYEAELVRILDRLEPRPVVLLTVTEYRPNYVEVNEVITRLAAERDNITVLDWSTISQSPGVLSSDRLHPTDTGRRVLAESVGAALGPVAGEGECLRSTFRDDSSVGGDTRVVLGRPSSGSTSVTTTTVPPSASATTTSAPGGAGGITSTTVSGSGVPPTAVPSTSPSTSAAPTTAAPTTAAPTTAPATTAAPTTAPPAPAPPSGLVDPTP